MNGWTANLNQDINSSLDFKKETRLVKQRLWKLELLSHLRNYRFFKSLKTCHGKKKREGRCATWNFTHVFLSVAIYFTFKVFEIWNKEKLWINSQRHHFLKSWPTHLTILFSHPFTYTLSSSPRQKRSDKQRRIFHPNEKRFKALKSLKEKIQPRRKKSIKMLREKKWKQRRWALKHNLNI